MKSQTYSTMIKAQTSSGGHGANVKTGGGAALNNDTRTFDASSQAHAEFSNKAANSLINEDSKNG